MVSCRSRTPIIDLAEQLRGRGTPVVTTPRSLKPPRIQALARASAIIDVIAAGDTDGTSLGEVCRITLLNKTTAFNLLASLVTLGFVEQDASIRRRYRLGLAQSGARTHRPATAAHLSSVAADPRRSLQEDAGDREPRACPTSSIYWVIDSYQGSRLLHATAYGGWRSLYHCTALGKAFLSRWDSPMRHTVYRLSGACRGLTPNGRSPTSMPSRRSWPNFGSRAMLVDVGENEVGVNGIARADRQRHGRRGRRHQSVAGHSNRLTSGGHGSRLRTGRRRRRRGDQRCAGIRSRVRTNRKIQGTTTEMKAGCVSAVRRPAAPSPVTLVTNRLKISKKGRTIEDHQQYQAAGCAVRTKSTPT